MMPAVQPLAFSIYTTTQQEMEPCSLLTESFYSLNCTRALDLYGGGLGPLGTQLACTGEPWGPYQTAFTACGAATSAIRMRNVGYAAVMININLLFYLILKECTRDMSEVALSKMARGHPTRARAQSLRFERCPRLRAHILHLHACEPAHALQAGSGLHPHTHDRFQRPLLDGHFHAPQPRVLGGDDSPPWRVRRLHQLPRVVRRNARRRAVQGAEEGGPRLPRQGGAKDRRGMGSKASSRGSARRASTLCS